MCINSWLSDTYSFTQADWVDDFQRMQAKGVDAVAMNIGSSSWQRAQVASAYAAAQSMGTGFKLFFSFDFTEMGCDVNDIISRVNEFANHPNQFKVNGRPMISSFAGDCLGHGGWAYLKAQTNGYVMPFIWGLEGQFNNWPELDSWFCWGCAWPQGNQDKTSADDEYYMSQLGSRYATSVSMWMFTHFGYKNFYQRGDNWLINNRWEQLVAMRDRLTFVEMVTWNDFGESDYFGPIKGEQPAGTTWATGFPHTAWFDMSQYYITAFKTGSYPPITQDVIYYWARPHPTHATASADPLGKPTGWDWSEDFLWAAVFATGPASVTLQCGGSSQTFNVNAGVNKLKVPTAPGRITVSMNRNGATIINQSPSDFTFTNNPTLYNYNAYVGAAYASGTPPPPPPPTTTTTAISTPTSTPVNGFSYYGCVAEGTTGSRRALTGASFSQPNMTPQVCQSLCSSFRYAGVEYSNECFCGNSLTNNGATGSVIPSGNCNSPCAGDSSQTCGGSWTLSVYEQANSQPVTWNSAGCYTDAQSRMLRGSSTSQGGMTSATCITICNSQGYTIAATEYGQECFCGSQLFKEGGAGNSVSAGECNMPCSGNPSETCGGSWRGNVYVKPGTSLSRRHQHKRRSHL
ncbi:hypothetical protein AX16_008410 [Volvariella volvacea WC 439]|nr:hypothetical protein AX16_008410 [Volvariella volvacea WC 439]